MKGAKRILKIFIITLTLLCLVAMGFFYAKKDSIKRYLLGNLNQHLTAEVKSGRIDVTLLRSFPEITLQLEDVIIENSLKKYPDSTFLTAEKIRLHLNIWQLLRKQYILQSITIKNAIACILINEEGKSNYILWETPAKNNGKSDFKIELKSVKLINVKTTFSNYKTGESYSGNFDNVILQGDFSKSESILAIKGDLFVQSITIKDQKYMGDQEIFADFQLHINSERNNYTISGGELMIMGIPLTITGQIEEKNPGEQELKISFESNQSQVSNYLALLPADVYEKFIKYRFSGKLTTNGSVWGIISKYSSPSFHVNFQLDNGEIIHKETNHTFSNIQCKGAWIINPAEQTSKEKVTIHSLSAIHNENIFTCTGEIIDFSSPSISLDAHIEANLSTFSDMIDLYPVSSLEGKVKSKIRFKGKIADLKTLSAKDLLMNDVSGTAIISDVAFKLANNPLDYQFKSGTIHFLNNNIEFSDIQGRISSSDVVINGKVIDFIPFLLLNNKKLQIKADITSQVIRLDEILKDTISENDTLFNVSFPDNIVADLSINAKEITFDRCQASDLQGSLSYKDKLVDVRSLSFNSMKGNINASGQIDGQKMHTRFNAKLEHVDISRMFYELRDFGQNNLTYHHINGSLTSELYFSASFFPDLSLHIGSIKATAGIEIDNGEIINYKPLMKLSSYLKINDLEHIRFKRLSNTISIVDYTITIPDMIIESQSFSMKLNGVHNFNNQIEYHLDFLLSDLLLGKIPEKSQEEFGVIIEDNEKAHLMVLITGNAENPTIKYDARAVGARISKNLKEESAEIKSVLQDEFKWMKQDSVFKEEEDHIDTMIKRQEEGNFILEWEKEEKKKPEPDTTTSKIKGSKFKVEWDDDTTSYPQL